MTEKTPAASRRRKVYIYKDFQRSFICSFCMATFGAMLAVSLILFILIELFPRQDNGILSILIWVNALVMLALVALAFIVALNVSHKIGGPLYRFENTLARIAQGDLTEYITLREGDKLQGLADHINAMSQNLNQRMMQVKSQVQQLGRQVRDKGADPELISALEELDRKIKELFKT